MSGAPRMDNAAPTSHRVWGRACLVTLAAVLGCLSGGPNAFAAVAAAPPPLSGDHSPANIASTYGSGSFGTWAVDEFGLPQFRYQTDETREAKAQQPELAGSSAAQHQVGNDHIKGMAYNDGYAELWSQDRLPEWANVYQPSSQHYAGGFGYLNVGGRVVSTLYLDRPADATFSRDFGVGYYRRRISADGMQVTESTYAPFGNDPVLLDDVTIRNNSAVPKPASWFEYWDVNPYDQALGEQSNIGLSTPTWDASGRTLSVGQVTPRDAATPLSIFAAAIQGPLDGFETSLPAFFGAGSRAAPAEVAADHLSGSLASSSTFGSPGRTLFALRSPVLLAPGHSVTLRYLYGIAHPGQIAGIVLRYRATADPFSDSERSWAQWLPRADFGASNAWVARELQWDAYLLRSASVYEEVCGQHTITQGGDYQYSDGYNLGFRSWPHYMLPMVYSDPELAREILRYSIQLQPQASSQFPYGTGPLCERRDLGSSDDLDFWLLLAATEYGLGSRDTRFFDEQLPFYDTKQPASAWEHIKLAFAHQEAQLGPHGGYLNGGLGDWDDGATEFEQMTESMLVLAQTAYVYPRLAELADLRGDHAFAAQLRAAGARDLATLRGQWTGLGWYSRGYSGPRQIGQGVIFGEPQPWAILAGAPSPAQAATLLANIHRFLDGVGAPASLHGPQRIGTATIPARDDPQITERGPYPTGSLGPTPDLQDAFFAGSPSSMQGAAEWPGGTWFDVNGWLTWAYGELDGVLPGARTLAWDEYTRNTLANHATQFPDHWDGTISVDDVCNAFYSNHPSYCGNTLSTAFAGQITEQPTWMVMDAIRMAGITPTQAGFRIDPHYPFAPFSLRLPQIGIASEATGMRGYVTPQQSGPIELDVRLPPQADSGSLHAWADGHSVPFALQSGFASFTLPATAGSPADWALTWGNSSPASRCAAAQLRFVIHQNNGRVRRVVVYVAGHRVRTVRAHRVRSVSIPAPLAPVQVRIVDFTVKHKRVITVRRVRGCQKGPPRTRVRRLRGRHR